MKLKVKTPGTGLFGGIEFEIDPTERHVPTQRFGFPSLSFEYDLVQAYIDNKAFDLVQHPDVPRFTLH